MYEPRSILNSGAPLTLSRWVDEIKIREGDWESEVGEKLGAFRIPEAVKKMVFVKKGLINCFKCCK